MIKNGEKAGNNKTKVSIIIPCRNEEKYISRCLDSLIGNSYPKDLMEVFIIDGMSNDHTRKIVKRFIEKHSFVKLIDNYKKIVPVSLNIGIKKAKGELIIRIDVHSTYPSDYIEKLVLWNRKTEADNVGGICITKPGANTVIGQVISYVLFHPFGVGNSYFRIGSKEPKYVDTVPFGCYRKEIFKKVGLFNEKLVRNQDLEFNLRLRKCGGRILLVPEILSYYYARSSLRALAKNNFSNGYWVIYSTKFAKMPFSARHLIPFFFVFLICGSLILSFAFRIFFYLFVLIFSAYSIVNIFFSFEISFEKGIKYFIPAILSFATLHFSYGFGSMKGLVKLLWDLFRKAT